MNALPEESPASAARRRALSHDWLTATEVLARTGITTNLDEWRRSGRVFGVWMADEHVYRYPPWQFDEAGQPILQLQSILGILRGPYGVALGKATSGWEEMEWWVAPHARFEGMSPAEQLSANPASVLATAELDFLEDPNVRW
jgi:hypothetical protein